MKKGKLKKILATGAMGIMALAMPFALTGCDKNDDINVRVDGDYIQWQVDGSDSWTNLLTIDEVKDLLGESYKGDTGAQGNPGVNGREVEFRTNDTHIQWRYVGDSIWIDLMELEELKGDEGVDASCVSYTVNYEYGCIPTIVEQFSNYKVRQEVKSHEWITDMPLLDEGNYAKDFLGWFIKGTDRQIKEYDFIGGDVILEAKWNSESTEMASRLCKGVNIVYEKDTYVAYTLNEEEIIVPKYYDDGENGEKIVTIVGSEIYDHSNTTKVTLQEGLTTILPNAFRKSNIKSIHLPASVSNISGYRSFFQCSELLEISVDADNDVYDSRNNCNAIVETSSNKIVLACKNTIIDNTITTIGEESFSYSKISTLKIPSTITEIEYGAFYDCNNLNSIWIPKSVEKMGANIFGRRLTQNYQSKYLLFVACEDAEKPELWDERWAECIKDHETIVWNVKVQKKSEDFIYSVTNDNTIVIQRCISNKNTFILTKFDELDIVEIDNYAFYGNDNLQEVNLESSTIKKLAKYSFYGCKNLKNIKLPSSLKNIEDAVFYNCDNLDYIFIDENSCLESVGSYNANSFATICCKDEYSENLDVVLPFNNVIYNFKELKQDENYIYAVLNDGTIHIINYIGDGQFVLIDTIEEKNVAEIGYYAFKGCNTLKTIYIKNDIIFASHNNPYYLSQYFTKQATSDKTGYDMYVRNAE